MQVFNFKNKKGVSLVEMMVVLVIISTTVISALSLIIRSTLEIRDNEVRDSVNGLMINISDALKSPARIQLKNFTPSTFVAGTPYAFRVEAQGNVFVLTYVSGSTTLSSCPSDSSFLYPISVTQSTLQNVCLMVSITLLSGSPTRYSSNIQTFYNLPQNNSTTTSNSLVTIRYEAFTLI